MDAEIAGGRALDMERRRGRKGGRGCVPLVTPRRQRAFAGQSSRHAFERLRARLRRAQPRHEGKIVAVAHEHPVEAFQAAQARRIETAERVAVDLQRMRRALTCGKGGDEARDDRR